jgi:hypothetical protein
MTPEQFTCWLQGYSEIANSLPNETERKIIQDHLKLVFDKQTPDRAYADTRLGQSVACASSAKGIC